MSAFVPTISIATPRGEVTVTIEIASTRAEIERGLMYRDHLPYDAGMLFLMGRNNLCMREDSFATWSIWDRHALQLRLDYAQR